MSKPLTRSFSLPAQRTHCGQCYLHPICLPPGPDEESFVALEDAVSCRISLRRQDTLFRAGDPLSAIYAVRTGTVKSAVNTQVGQGNVLGFHLPGELLGLDAFATGHHCCTAYALEDASLCVIPYPRLEEVASQIPGLYRRLLCLTSQALNQRLTQIQLLSRPAEARIAALLLDLSERYQERGYSPVEFNLSMTRYDIGDYLGLAVETVSRVFRRFQEAEVVRVKYRNIRLVDPAKLRAIAGQR